MAGATNGKPINPATGNGSTPPGSGSIAKVIGAAPGIARGTGGAAITPETRRSTKHAEPSTPPGPKRVFTTGEAADVCKVSQQTVIRCFDAGRLGGFRVPGSKFRRIPRADLLKFMKTNGIPLENLAKFEGTSVSALAEDDGATKRILVVDDDAQILEMFKDLFAEDKRFTLKFAANGYDAGMLTEGFRPHLMILDFMLPDMNGDVVCRRLRGIEHLKETKVLFVSGVVSQADIERLSSAGASGFIAKPFDVGALMKRVEQLVGVESMK